MQILCHKTRHQILLYSKTEQMAERCYFQIRGSCKYLSFYMSFLLSFPIITTPIMFRASQKHKNVISIIFHPGAVGNKDNFFTQWVMRCASMHPLQDPSLCIAASFCTLLLQSTEVFHETFGLKYPFLKL